MPRNAKRSADAQLDQLRQAVAAERVKARDLETQLEAARLEVEGAARAVTDAYAEDDAKLAALRRQELQAAEGDVANLGLVWAPPGCGWSARSRSLTRSSASTPAICLRSVSSQPAQSRRN